MIENHIQNHLNTGCVKGLYHLFEFANLRPKLMAILKKNGVKKVGLKANILKQE